MKKRLLIIFIIICFLGIGCLLWYQSIETRDIEKQEVISQQIAEEYLIAVNEKKETIDSSEEQTADFDYIDNKIYGKYKESNARGSVDCILEIPSIDLRQSVFTGTPKQIEHDLRNWLMVTGRADYKLGETHYCIYSHNPTNKSIKISKAQDNIKSGDYMVVIKNDTVYFYGITRMFAEWREKCTEQFVDNMAIDKNMLYVFTCGRGEWQYRNVLIEGKLYETYNFNDWNENKDEYVKKYKKNMNDSDIKKKPMDMLCEIENDQLKITLITDDNKNIENCSIGVFNKDGYLIETISNPIDYKGESILLPKLNSGTYCVGIYENNTEYDNPNEYEIIIDSKKIVQKIKTVEEANKSSQREDIIIKYISIIMLSSSLLMAIFTMVKRVKRKKKSTKNDE